MPKSTPNGSSSPASTYRLQIRPSFDLHAAAAACDYLATLGVDALYLSPLLPSAAGSDHGYDVVAWDRVDPQRGGFDGWTRLLAAARSRSLRIVVDIVPNHASTDSAAWQDVQRKGAESEFADWFDIEWAQGRIAHYRRFFAVDSLAGLRVEDGAVFDATHKEILRWVREDGVVGLRIDHPDGLADPLGYLQRLRAAVGPDVWLLVEKILEHGEQVPRDWPVAGTTGYDALAEVSALFLDPEQTDPVTDVYRRLGRDTRSFAEHAADGKRQVANTILWPEVQRLARLVPGVRDAQQALLELLVCFPVYRSYLPVGTDYLTEALDWVRYDRPDLAEAVDALTPRLADPQDELAIRFQQTSGAVMAKGVEDTAYYRYARMIGLNEVGGNPARVGITPADWHELQDARLLVAPRGMTALSTHDTKRGEDVRARLAVLAEVPDDWADLATRLMAAAPIADVQFAYLLWQTLVGAGFVDRERLHAYAEKAMREAALTTNWMKPNTEFEASVHTAIDRAYDDASLRGPVAGFIERITPYGWTNSLGQKIVQLTMPGVPDVYQGTETWEDSLVDPDNRRAVDFGALASRLAALDAASVPPAVDASGDAKLWLVSRVLRVRRARPELFGSYAPVQVTGVAAAHAVAFDRGGAITVATRLPVGLEARGGWGDTTITLAGEHTDALTGRPFSGEVHLADLLATYPVALLTS